MVKGIILIGLFLCLGIAMAEDLITRSGAKYEDYKITRPTSKGVTVAHKRGVVVVPYDQLPDNIAVRYQKETREAEEANRKETEARIQMQTEQRIKEENERRLLKEEKERKEEKRKTEERLKNELEKKAFLKENNEELHELEMLSKQGDLYICRTQDYKRVLIHDFHSDNIAIGDCVYNKKIWVQVLDRARPTRVIHYSGGSTVVGNTMTIQKRALDCWDIGVDPNTLHRMYTADSEKAFAYLLRKNNGVIKLKKPLETENEPVVVPVKPPIKAVQPQPEPPAKTTTKRYWQMENGEIHNSSCRSFFLGNGKATTAPRDGYNCRTCGGLRDN